MSQPPHCCAAGRCPSAAASRSSSSRWSSNWFVVPRLWRHALQLARVIHRHHHLHLLHHLSFPFLQVQQTSALSINLIGHAKDMFVDPSQYNRFSLSYTLSAYAPSPPRCSYSTNAFRPSACDPLLHLYPLSRQNPKSLIFCSVGALLIVAGGACYSFVTWGEGAGAAAAGAVVDRKEGYVAVEEGRGDVVALR